ncbi:hypothetical protein ACHAWF_001684, partial [Thalassiosira exigua]
RFLLGLQSQVHVAAFVDEGVASSSSSLTSVSETVASVAAGAALVLAVRSGSEPDGSSAPPGFPSVSVAELGILPPLPRSGSASEGKARRWRCLSHDDAAEAQKEGYDSPS